MVTKISAIERVVLTGRDHRNATDGAKKRPQNKSLFKEVLSKQLSAKPPVKR